MLRVPGIKSFSSYVPGIHLQEGAPWFFQADGLGCHRVPNQRSSRPKGSYKSRQKSNLGLVCLTRNRSIIAVSLFCGKTILPYMASRHVPFPKLRTQQQTRTCLCSPTTHPGSFRCSMHKNFRRVSAGSRTDRVGSNTKWELSVVAKANSFKTILLQIIKPSSHDLHRRREFQPRPTRFCLMNANRDGLLQNLGLLDFLKEEWKSARIPAKGATKWSTDILVPIKDLLHHEPKLKPLAAARKQWKKPSGLGLISKIHSVLDT
ncbi:unnamed protein product, partial [Dovyalis caffra]